MLSPQPNNDFGITQSCKMCLFKFLCYCNQLNLMTVTARKITNTEFKKWNSQTTRTVPSWLKETNIDLSAAVCCDDMSIWYYGSCCPNEWLEHTWHYLEAKQSWHDDMKIECWRQGWVPKPDANMARCHFNAWAVDWNICPLVLRNRCNRQQKPHCITSAITS